MTDWVIAGGQVLRDGQLAPGIVGLRDGKLAAPATGRRFEAGGLLVMPGIVDIHGTRGAGACPL